VARNRRIAKTQKNIVLLNRFGQGNDWGVPNSTLPKSLDRTRPSLCASKKHVST